MIFSTRNSDLLLVRMKTISTNPQTFKRMCIFMLVENIKNRDIAIHEFQII